MSICTDSKLRPNDIYSIKVTDVKKRFTEMEEHGSSEEFGHMPYFSNIAVDHIQGYTQYKADKMSYIFTHSLSGREAGRILMTHAPNQQHLEIRTPSGWNHPGGIQCIGPYLFVPCEKDNQAKVFLYNTTSIQAEPLDTFDLCHRAGCLGITDFIHAEKPNYLLLIGDGTQYYAYLSAVPADGDMATLMFSPIGWFNLSGLDCQGFGLVTDTSNDVFMIALHSQASGSTYADWGHLFSLSVVDGKINCESIPLASKHLISKGGVSGVAGSHFRWGAGIRVTADGKIALLATSRNIIAGGKLNTTYWITS